MRGGLHVVNLAIERVILNIVVLNRYVQVSLVEMPHMTYHPYLSMVLLEHLSSYHQEACMK